MNLNPTFETAGTHTPDNLHADDFPLMTDTVTLASGATYKRGAVLGKITASGKYKLSASAASDGSQTPDVVLLQDADATDADVAAPVALTGAFNARRLIFGTGHTATTAKDALRAKSIFVRGSVSQ